MKTEDIKQIETHSAQISMDIVKASLNQRNRTKRGQ